MRCQVHGAQHYRFGYALSIPFREFTNPVTRETMRGMDANSARTAHVRRLVKEAGGPAEFGRRHGWQQAQVSQWISAHDPKGIGRKLAREIEKRLGLPENSLDRPPAAAEGYLRPISVWNDREDLPPAATVFLPKLDYLLSAGNGGPDPGAVELTDKTMPFDAAWAKAEGWTPTTHYTMRASGESMEPTIQHNAPVVIDTSAKTIRTGLVYAVLIDGEPLLKRLDKLPGGRIRVRSDNPSPAYAPYEVDGTEIQLIGRAVWTPTRL